MVKQGRKSSSIVLCIIMILTSLAGIFLFPETSLAVSNVPAIDFPTIKTNPDGNPYIVGPIICPLWNEGEHYGWDAISAYQDRKPLIGYYDQNNPEVWDWFIKWSAERGCTFFNFVWFNREGTDNPCFDNGLSAFKQSKFFNSMKYAFTIVDYDTLTSADDFQQDWWPYMREQFLNPQYLKVDNKPVLFWFTIPPDTQNVYDRIRSLAVGEGFSGVYIIAVSGSGNPDYTYIYSEADLNYGINPTPAEEAYGVQHIMAKLGEAGNVPLVDSSRLHPSNLDYDAVRTWVAPSAGSVTIAGNVRKGDTGGGDGVRVKIMKNGTQLWPASGWQTIAYNDATGYDHNIYTSVNAGDRIYFIVNSNMANHYNDMTIWDPLITLGGTAYQASAGFSSTQGQNQWRYQYCTAGGSDYTDFTSYNALKACWYRPVGRINKIPNITMGFDRDPWDKKYFGTTGWRGVSWRMTPDGYENEALQIKAWMDNDGEGLARRLVLLGAWDEFGEGHYICPTEEYGYGYLDAIRSVFTECDNEPYDLNPLEDGFGPYDNNYKHHTAYYSFDEGQGNTINDGSGFDRDAIKYGGTWTDSGKFGSALDLNGTSDYVQISGYDATKKGFLHNYYMQRSVSMWIKTQSTNGMLYEQGDSDNGLAIKIQNGNLAAGHAANGRRYSISCAYPNDGLWHHVVVSLIGQDYNIGCDNTNLYLYLDGEHKGTVACPHDFIDPSAEGTYLGKRSGTDAFNESGDGAYFDGVIDDVIITRALYDDGAGFYYKNPGSIQFYPEYTNIIDDRNERVKYSQGFRARKYYDANNYNRSSNRTNLINEYFEMSFYGNNVQWITETGPDHGLVDVYIDGVLDSTVDCYSATDAYKVQKYVKTDLSTGNHTIRIVNKENKWLVNDRFVISEGILYQASTDFSGSQGLNQWYYQYCTAGGSNYTDMATWDSSGSCWWRSGTDDLPLIGSSTMHPSNLDYDAVRTWVAPGDGTVDIVGNVKKADIGGGDGVRVKIMKNGTQIWPSSGWQTIAYNDSTGYDYNITTSVTANDKIYFIVNANTVNHYNDMTAWDPLIYYDPKADAINQDDKNSIIYFFNNRPISSSTNTFRILFIGDSLTLVGPTAGVWDWYSGMAATDVNKDFVHLFANRVQQNKTKQVEIFYNASGKIADMKSNLDKYILDLVRPHLVVMQGGENDTFNEAYRILYDQLLGKFASFENANGEPLRVIVLGDWWDSAKSEFDQSIAQKYGYPFVNILQFNTLENIGYGGPYDHPGVASHPNDSGMQDIADALYNAFLTLGDYW